MEIEASGVERQLAEIEQAANLGLGFGEQIFICQVEHTIGILLAPETREAQKIDAVVGQLVEIAGECTPLAEKLAETGQAGFHRIAPNDHHSRRRQHRQRRADEIPAQQTLVGEPRLGLAPARGAREIFAAETLPVFRGGIGHPQWERRMTARGFRVDHLGHVLDLVRARDLRMRGENLLDQGRTGARNADDQDDFAAETVVQRRGCSVCKYALDLFYAFALPRRVPFHPPAARGIGDAELLEGLCVVALVFQRLRIGETEQFAVARRQVRARQGALQ